MANRIDRASGDPDPRAWILPAQLGGGWVSRQVAAMSAAWGRGEAASAADVLARHSDLDAEAAIRLIYEEACLRREAGLEVDTAEIMARHPRWADELRDLFDCDRLFRASGAPVAFPEAGETLGPFLLTSELGRGASGRAFLATDPGLADRPVVVKVIPDDQDEHLALARLRHTHIVPLFSEHALADRGLRVLCMPYLGGTSLAEILAGLADVPVERRSGKHLLAVLDRHTRPMSATPPAAGPFRRGLERASYVDALTWIAVCLADALDYAHARGIVHMDLKPSNVLIAADGQPMLLDFHLARGPIAAGERVAGRLGGTPGWMAPEQEAALVAAGRGRHVPAAVDGRSDLFALGLLLREALTSSGPGGGGGAGRATFRRPPGVSVALADIVRKCLAPDPRSRYGDAALLAEDLRRQLDDLPLRGVRNRDPRERWRKWERRHPGAFAWGIAACSILASIVLAVTAGFVAYRHRVDRVRIALEDGRMYQAAGHHDEADQVLMGALDEVRNLPAAEELRDLLNQQLLLCRRNQLAEELHELADSVRFRQGIELPSDDEAWSLARLCRAIWDRRDRLVSPVGSPLEPDAEQRIKTDLLELAAVQVDLLIRLAPHAGDGEVERDALRFLEEAEAALGPSFALDLRREQLLAAAGRTPVAPEWARRPRSAWEHYDLGRYHLRSGRFEEAGVAFRHALESRPQDFWSNFNSGLCAYRLGRFEAAAAAFHTCVALAPESAICYFDRGLAYDALGRTDEATRDYTRAIELDPDLAEALLNRGIIAHRAGRHLQAVADFDRGVRARPDRETLGRLHYNLALTQLSRGDLPSAQTHAEAADRLGNEEAHTLRDDLR